MKTVICCVLAGSLVSTAADSKKQSRKIPVQVEQGPDSESRLGIDDMSETSAASQPGRPSVTQVACPVPSSARDGAFEIGAMYGVLFPSGLVGASETLPTLSVVLGAPVLGQTLQVQVNYGSTTTVRMLIAELNMRWAFDSPYLNSYFITGAHYLNQESDTTAASNRGALGLTAGIGLSFDLGKQLEAHFDVKGYVQNRTTILIGGGFSILL